MVFAVLIFVEVVPRLHDAARFALLRVLHGATGCVDELTILRLWARRVVSDLETLFPGRDVAVGGETIRVSPLYFGQYPRALQLMRPLFDAVKGAGIFSVVKNGTQVKFEIAADWPLRLPELIADGGEALVEFVAFCIGKPRPWFNTLPGDDGFELTKAVFEENASFFAKRIRPKLEQMGIANPPIGEESSPISSEPDTAGPTSDSTHEIK